MSMAVIITADVYVVSYATPLSRCHAQLRFLRSVAVVQGFRAICLRRMPRGLLVITLIRLLQKCAALKSQTLVSAMSPHSARMTSIGVLFQEVLLTSVIPRNFCMCFFTSPAFWLDTFWENSLPPHTSRRPRHIRLQKVLCCCIV